MGANISSAMKEKNEEVVCDIEVSSSKNGCELDSEISDLMIDEYPILAVAASLQI